MHDGGSSPLGSTMVTYIKVFDAVIVGYLNQNSVYIEYHNIRDIANTNSPNLPHPPIGSIVTCIKKTNKDFYEINYEYNHIPPQIQVDWIKEGF